MTDLDRSSIQRGHRELLATFREFVQPLACPAGTPEMEELRGVVAFLREGVMGFARREEASLAAGEEARESAAREHAFIAAEADLLAREVTSLMHAHREPEPECETRLARIQRLSHRIEAVLEVHLLRDEEYAPEPPPPSESAAPAGPVAHVANGMTPAEASDFLGSHRWGVLCTVGGGRPYAVPVSYAFDGRHLYLATGPGRKADNLDASPSVCLTVPDVVDGQNWRSVVVTGEAHRLTDLPSRLRALRLLARERARTPTAKDLARAARARVLRVVPTEITGRREGSVGGA
jgi:nitroimidazol reductase NimA-like FMN-containing flavoprotein (pyridoxamine 5'-phosphate oxidase superfamily)